MSGLDNYTWKTVEEISTPIDGGQVLVNNWWPVDAQGRVAIYNPQRGSRRQYWGDGSPQANSDERVTRMLATKVHKWAVDCIQIPVAYLRIDPRDY